MIEQRGFTLLEVLVALAVFAALGTAVASAGQWASRQAAALESRVFAAWVADNHLTELRLQAPVGPARQLLQRRMNDRDWRVSQVIEPVPGFALRAVTLSVSLGDESPLFTLHGWLPDE